MIPIERTHEYRGLYHVLGGALSPIDGVDAEDLKIAELLRRVERGGVERGRARDQPDDDRRGDRAAHRRTAARPGRRSPAWPAACRSAPTSSTPTRSRSARRSPAAAASISRAATEHLSWTIVRPANSELLPGAGVRRFRQGPCVADARRATATARVADRSGTPAGRMAREVSAQQAALLAKLREELGSEDGEALAAAAQRLAAEFGVGHRDRGRRRLRRSAAASRRRAAEPLPRSPAAKSCRASTSPATCAAGSTS